MVKFPDTPKRRDIDLEGLRSIHRRMFGVLDDRQTVRALKTRIKAYGRCECGCKKPLKGRCDWEHSTPLAMQIQEQGAPPPPVHWEAWLPECHSIKTNGDENTKGDKTLIAETKRKARKYGVLRETHPMPEKRGNRKLQGRSTFQKKDPNFKPRAVKVLD